MPARGIGGSAAPGNGGSVHADAAAADGAGGTGLGGTCVVETYSPAAATVSGVAGGGTDPNDGAAAGVTGEIPVVASSDCAFTTP
jgi:hypothetical protein